MNQRRPLLKSARAPHSRNVRLLGRHVIHQRVNNVHWNYLLALDADTAVVARYVEFNPANYNTYSIELARLLMAAASEVDVVAKIACSRVNPATTAGNIEEYRLELVPARPNLPGYPIQINRFGLDFKRQKRGQVRSWLLTHPTGSTGGSSHGSSASH